MLVSVLVATRDRPEPLRRCLESVMSQDVAGLELEVLIFDDASTVPARAAAAAVDDVRVRWLRSEENLGVVGARNALMREGRGDKLLFLDDDAYLAHPGCLREMVGAFSASPRAGILAGKIFDHRDGRERLLVPFPRRALVRDPSLAVRPRPAGYFLGGLHALRREVVREIGGYAPQLVFGEEELDLAYRVVQAGWEIRYVPELLAHHVPPPAAGDWAGRRSRLYFSARNRLYLAHTYLPTSRRAVYLGVWMSVLAARALREGRTGDFLAGLRDGWKARRSWTRRTLGREALAYLRANHGRVWY